VLELTYQAPSTPASRVQRGAVRVELMLPQILGSERELLAGLLLSQLLALDAGD